ncbi:MAG: glycosyltransferase family 2 protein [Planctomycetaceae bacterium]
MHLSMVIPVYNAAATIGPLVERIHELFEAEDRPLGGEPFEIVLVNDGSDDDSETVCGELADRHPETVRFLQLSRNFGEHSAVLAGMNAARGEFVAVLDDDGQNPPEEVLRMVAHLTRHGYDVVYGRYRERKHGWFRQAGSAFNDRMANFMLGKPKHIYFSSFKVMSRFIVDRVVEYRGPFPYIDGLIYRTTTNIGQIDVEHRERQAGESGYTLKKLVKLWLNMFLGFSIAPLRLMVLTGFGIALLGGLGIVAVLVDKWINPEVPHGIPTVLVSISFFAGVQLMVIGMIGEYVGRIFLEQNGMPQYVIRYEKQGNVAGRLAAAARPRPDDGFTEASLRSGPGHADARTEEAADG